MIYKYFDENGWKSLRDGFLFARSLDDFNDPFEWHPIADLEKTRQLVRTEISDPDRSGLLQKAVLEYGIPEHLSLEEKIERLSQEQHKQALWFVDQQLAKNKKSLAFVCFSRDPKNIQMWSYYSQNHTGMVIGYDENRLITTPTALMQVGYYHEPLTFGVGLTEKSTKEMSRKYPDALAIKQIGWAHEKEVRAMIHMTEEARLNSNTWKFEVEPAAVKEVIFGMRATVQTIEVSKAILQTPEFSHVKIFKATATHCKFEIEAKEIST